MRIVQLLLCVLFCHNPVGCLLVDLGSNVTLTCDLDVIDVYWILQKSLDPPTVLLRSFLAPASSLFLNKNLKSKYSVQFNHSLVINNVTADDSGVYYCMKAGVPPKFSSSTRIETRVSLDYTNNATSNCKDVVIISGVVNGLQLFLLIGLLKVFMFRKRKLMKDSRQVTAEAQQTPGNQDGEQLQYATMDFSKFHKKVRSSQINSTYSTINLPKC